MLRRVLIIVNPVAGKGLAIGYAEDLQKVLKEYHQSFCHIRITQQGNDAYEWARRAIFDGYDAVFCLGGDGTVSEVVRGIMQNNKRPFFGFIPLGTVNDLARSIGYSLSPSKAIEEFKLIKITHLDVGQVNDSYFINVIAIGNIAQDVMYTQSENKNRFGVFAYIADGVSAFFSKESFHIRVRSNKGHDRKIFTNLLLVGLTNSVGSVEFAFNDASYNDNLLHFAAVIGDSPLHTFGAAIEHGFYQIDSKFLDNRNFWTFDAEEIVITSIGKGEIVSNVDGDPGPTSPFNLKVIPNAIPLIVPLR